jgi:hypothetical protein
MVKLKYIGSHLPQVEMEFEPVKAQERLKKLKSLSPKSLPLLQRMTNNGKSNQFANRSRTSTKEWNSTPI